ncbi:hypothetical protein BGAL_0002g00340 [Botrytis galanthina]|uniref:Heterokaryon incompatibility domain-containing protein n=1 Tax=Botrytis galanthina TaxID=278940 RepID=A0A4S8RLV6_9HELO|nr:hypothetical protein BGAL_0002g00340 [Botrytis galanthina]
MFLASSFLRCRPVPFRTQATSSFIAPRLFRTSINRTFRQTNIKYAFPLPSPSPPRWKGVAAKLFSLRIITAPLGMVALAIEESFVSRSRLIRFAAKPFIFGFVDTSIYKGIHEVPKLRRSLPQREADLGTALSCVPVVIWYFVGFSAIWKVRESLSPWKRLTARFFIHVSLPISTCTVFDVGRELLSSYPRYPPLLRKSLDEPLSYQHDVLPQEYIRLISVKAGKPNDPIELNLNSIRFRLPDRTKWIPAKYVPRYEALSYTWDEDERKDKIDLNNIHLELVVVEPRIKTKLKSVWQVLRQLRFFLKTKFEYVHRRKNSKLKSDWDILYSTSWDTALRRVLFVKLKELITGKEMNLSFEILLTRYRKEREKEPIVQKIDWHTGPEYSSGWKAIKKILARPYFIRSWIIQEIVLFSNRSVFIGDYNIIDILHFIELLHTTPEIQRQLASECRIEPELTSRIHNMIKGFLKFEYKDTQNLGKLLATFRGKGSTIPADQVYSLLGLTVERNVVHDSSWLKPSRARTRRFPEIDYKHSIGKLCTDTTKYILTQDGNLDALRMLNTHVKPTNEKNWPSWVPDFTSPLPGLGEPERSTWWRPLVVSRTSVPREKVAFRIEDNKLLVYGHLLSEIREPIRIVENNGRRDKELKHENRRIGERRYWGFLPISIWEDSEGREVHGTVDVKKGDLVVIVAPSQSPLILRRLKDAQRGKEGKECEWPEYNIVGTAHQPELNISNFEDLAKKIRWDFQKMAIV